MKRRLLLTPGPVNVPPDVLLEMAQPMIHHRAPDFNPIFSACCEDLKYVFQTKNDVLTFASSGSGAMEASVCNTLSAGDKAIVVRGGKFGERWAEICEAYGVEVIAVDVEWGTAVEPSVIDDLLKKNPDVKAVMVTLVETSTGVITDIEAIAKIVNKTDAIIFVDAVSSLGGEFCKTDEWGLDIVVTGSQKCLMLPPGLAFAAVSDKAWAMVEKSTLPKYYWSFKKAQKALAKNTTAFTPAVSLLIGLRATLKSIKDEGLDNVIARHTLLGNALAGAMEALGLELFSKCPSHVVTPVNVPDGVDGKGLVKYLRDEYGITIAGGQAQLEGKIFRIAAMGACDQFDALTCVSAIEMALKAQGYPVKLGAGLDAAERILTE